MTSMLSTLSEQFTNASLAGSYGLVGIGRGGQTQTASIFNERLLVKASFQGTYTVDQNGSGYGSTKIISANVH